MIRTRNGGERADTYDMGAGWATKLWEQPAEMFRIFSKTQDWGTSQRRRCRF